MRGKNGIYLPNTRLQVKYGIIPESQNCYGNKMWMDIQIEHEPIRAKPIRPLHY
jgi:hypothetical protein